jgi:hypothetical protein
MYYTYIIKYLHEGSECIKGQKIKFYINGEVQIKGSSVAYSSQGNHTDQLDFCN